jgi:hypothetical protein
MKLGYSDIAIKVLQWYRACDFMSLVEQTIESDTRVRTRYLTYEFWL